MVKKCLEVSYDLLQTIAQKPKSLMLKNLPPKKVNEFYSSTPMSHRKVKPALKRLGTGPESRNNSSRRKKNVRFRISQLHESFDSAFYSPSDTRVVENLTREEKPIQEDQVNRVEVYEELSDPSINMLVRNNFSPCKGRCESCSLSPITNETQTEPQVISYFSRYQKT